MKKRFSIPALMILVVVAGYGQRIDKVHLTLSGTVALPREALRTAVDNGMGGLGVGLGTSVVFNPIAKRKNSPFLLGIDFNYITFGRDKTEATDIAPAYKTSFNFYSACGLIRFIPQPDKTGFVPFIDGMLGAKIMNARTKVDKNFFNTINKDQDEVINNMTDSSLGYAMGIGFFNRRFNEDSDGNLLSKGSFTVRVLYHWGASASHVKRGSLQIDNNGVVSYETGVTDLDMIMVHIGAYLF